MALITCPDCGKQISSSAMNCPNCGYPLNEKKSKGIVRVKIPATLEGVKQGFFASRKAEISGDGVFWQGQLGDTARFEVSGSTEIAILLGNSDIYVEGVVHPNCNYDLVFQRKGWLGNIVYCLSESW